MPDAWVLFITEVDRYTDKFKKREILLNNVTVQHANELNSLIIR